MMNLARTLATLRKQISIEIDTKLTRMFGFTLTASTSSMGDTDAMQVSDVAKDGQRPVQRIEPFGLRSRPLAKMRGLWLRMGSSNVAFIGLMPSKGYGPVELEEGETALYSENVEKGVLLNKAGDVALESKSGQLVTINGDDFSLPKWDNAATALKAFATTAKAATTAAQIATAANTLELAFTAANNFKSDKAKNG